MVSLGCSAHSSVSHWVPFLVLILCDNAEPCIFQVLCRTAAVPMYLERYLVGIWTMKDIQ